MIKLTERDKAIISDLERFRVMDRDSVAELHFKSLKNPIQGANAVLKRLHRDRLIQRSPSFTPFVYMPSDSKMKQNSQKILHYLEILNVYKDMCSHKKPKLFTVEPKYSKGEVEPDALALWKGGVFFIEVQRQTYSSKVMGEKIERYEAFYYNGNWHEEPWQPENQAIFPTVLMITPTQYKIETQNVKVIQVTSIAELLVKYGGQQPQDIQINEGNLKMKGNRF